jgi:hypothetical protein
MTTRIESLEFTE